MTKEYYEWAATKRPTVSKKAQFLMNLNSILYLRKLPLIKKLLCKELKMPLSTSFNKGFQCTAAILNIEENVAFADTLIIGAANLYIGKNTSFSFRNIVITGGHSIENFHITNGSPVRIGKNVWITTGVIIMPGVTIGDNTIIGPGSIVIKDIPSNVYAMGNPCKVVTEIDFNKK